MVKAKVKQAVPQAILISGGTGLGNDVLAKNLAALLFCEAADCQQSPCNCCKNCLLFRSDNHPDFSYLKTDQGKLIKIDQVRELIAKVNLTSNQGGYLVVIIDRAELLNTAAANALLKTIEEPPEKVIIILVSGYPELLPITIRSRCLELIVHPPAEDVAISWLNEQTKGELDKKELGLLLSFTSGSVVHALELYQQGAFDQRKKLSAILIQLIEDQKLLTAVNNFLTIDFDEFLVDLMQLVTALVKFKLKGDYKFIGSEIVTDFNHEILSNLEASRLFDYQKQLLELRGYHLNQVNLNQQLAIENLLISWLGLFQVS